MDNFIKNFRQNSIYLDLVATVTNRKLHFIMLEEGQHAFRLTIYTERNKVILNLQKTGSNKMFVRNLDLAV